MEIDEAKAFYKKYLGKQFQMGREEWLMYQRFLKLEIGDEQLMIWDQELFEEQLALLWENPEQIWIRHENLLEILLRGKCDPNYYGRMLLEEMDKMTSLDEMNLILIIENMAGRDRDLKRGGAWFYCTKTKLVSKLKSCMEKILASAPAEPVDGGRLKGVVEHYQEAMRRYDA